MGTRLPAGLEHAVPVERADQPHLGAGASSSARPAGAAWLKAAPRRRYIEAGCVDAGAARWSASPSSVRFAHRGVTVLLLAPLPLFLWAAVRFGTGGVSAALLGFAFVVIWSVAHGQGPFAATSPLEATWPCSCS